MNSFDDRLKEHFGRKLPEGEELYTNENLKSIEKIKSLIDEDLSFLLHQLVLLDLKVRLTEKGQEKLDSFFQATEHDKYFNENAYSRFAEIVERGFSLFLFSCLGDFEDLTGTSGETKWVSPELHREYLETHPQLTSLFEKSCKAEKLNELLKDTGNLRKPYGIRPTSEYVDFIEQPSEKGLDD